MTLADRILELRKQKGYSQEELADRLGVSRQAVSKWESEQSTPDMDKIILMSDLFEVTTDYLLKGIEPLKEGSDKLWRIGNAVSLIAPWMVWIGYISSCALWYENQNAFAIMCGFVWLIGSLVPLYSARLNRAIDNKAVCRYWMISLPIWTLFLGSLVFNAFSGILAPYPIVFQNRLMLFGAWLLVMVSINIYAEFRLANALRK